MGAKCGPLIESMRNKQRYLMPEGINARVSRYYIYWHSITIICYTFVQQLKYAIKTFLVLNLENIYFTVTS